MTGKLHKAPISLLYAPLLSLLITTGIILLFLPVPTKYNGNLKSVTSVGQTSCLIYDDLDGNGYSDRIVAANYLRDHNLSAVLVHCNPKVLIKEWDVKGTFSFSNQSVIKTEDFDNDKKREIYFFTCSGDSVFLHYIPKPYDLNSKCVTRYITTFLPLNGKPNLAIYLGEMADFNRDGFGDLLFSINSGFSLDPRRVFIFDIRNDILNQSPQIGFMGRPFVVGDMNQDGSPDIAINGYATQNVPDSSRLPYHDDRSWFIVLDSKLNYLFPPREFPDKGYSAVLSYRIGESDSATELALCYFPPVNSEKGTTLYTVDKTATFRDSVSFPAFKFGDPFLCFPFTIRGEDRMVVFNSPTTMTWYDKTLHKLKETKFTKPILVSFFYSIDLDSDGAKEKIVLDLQNSQLVIFRPDLSHPVYIFLPRISNGESHVSAIYSSGENPVLSLFTGKEEVQISYSKNPNYYLRWSEYFAVFLIIYLFIILILKIQRVQIQRRQKSEKKITELQLKIVHNQMDPHFTMNAINSVIDAVNRDNKEEAGKNLMHFSRMYRSLVLSADKIKRSLKEELDFTENYLALEKFRFQERFDYQVEISPNVYLQWEIPKMIIQSPVENAVKHGITTLSHQGMIRISCVLENESLVIAVEDNGVGRSAAALQPSSSTGRGMEIMREFLELYERITGTKVSTEIVDLSDPEGRPSGTKVIVRIHNIVQR